MTEIEYRYEVPRIVTVDVDRNTKWTVKGVGSIVLTVDECGSVAYLRNAQDKLIVALRNWLAISTTEPEGADNDKSA